jgi:hypothetical protein
LGLKEIAVYLIGASFPGTQLIDEVIMEGLVDLLLLFIDYPILG